MSEYRSNGSSSTSKALNTAMKSPFGHENVDAKTYKRKYERKFE